MIWQGRAAIGNVLVKLLTKDTGTCVCAGEEDISYRATPKRWRGDIRDPFAIGGSAAATRCSILRGWADLARKSCIDVNVAAHATRCRPA